MIIDDKTGKPLTKEQEELLETAQMLEQVIELQPIKPYTPNRADRRAMSKKARKKGSKRG